MSWDIKDIVSLVQMGVMSVQTAREMLGMDKVKENARVLKQEKGESEGMYSSAGENHICDDCAFFDDDNHRCLNTDEPRAAWQRGCWQWGRDGKNHFPKTIHLSA